MKLLTLFSYISIQLILFVQQASEQFDIIKATDKLTTVGVLAYVAFQLNKNIRENRKAYQVEEEKMRAEYKEDQRLNREEIGKLAIVINGLDKNLIKQQASQDIQLMAEAIHKGFKTLSNK